MIEVSSTSIVPERALLSHASKNDLYDAIYLVGPMKPQSERSSTGVLKRKMQSGQHPYVTIFSQEVPSAHNYKRFYKYTTQRPTISSWSESMGHVQPNRLIESSLPTTAMTTAIIATPSRSRNQFHGQHAHCTSHCRSSHQYRGSNRLVLARCGSSSA